MHNIHDLEKRWLSYKIKSFIPHFLFLVISIVVLTILLNIDAINLNSKKEITKFKEKSTVDSKPIEKVELKEQNILPLLKIEQITNVQEKVMLTPSFDFVKKLRNNSNNSYKSNDFSSQDKKLQKKQTIQKKKIKTVAKIKTEDKVNINKLNIQRQETRADIDHVIKRFNKRNNPALSLFVAKKYYRIGEYDKAYNYALITNRLNNEIDESWIIFSKSLVKLNKKDKAIKVLTKYIQHSHSSNAKLLLDNITSGKFR